MKINKVKVAGFAVALACFAGKTAQGAPSISGFVEASYNYNLTIPADSMINAGHSYDAQSKTFTLNNAHLALSGSDSATSVGYDVETDIGSDAKANAGLSNGQGAVNYFDIQEAYLTYAYGPGKAWGLKAGKYATYQGIEVVEGGSNPTITRGFLYGFAEPVTHTGVEASYASSMWDLHVGLVNGWDQVADLNTMPTLLAKLGLNLGDPLALTVSTLIGSEIAAGDTKHLRESFDATGVTKSIKKVDLWFQANYGMEAKAAAGSDATWFGVGVQPLIHFDDKFGLGLRYEYFNDAKGVRTASPGKINLQNVSIAPTFWLNKYLTARAEYRVDFADQKVFNSGKDKNQMEVAADLIASF